MTTTANPTVRGDAFASKLNPYIGTTSEIRSTCALLHRLAVTYDRIQERWCNEEMTDRRTALLEAKESSLEARITDLVASLPQPDDGRWGVEFQGDPRSYTVRIVTPDGYEIGIYEGK